MRFPRSLTFSNLVALLALFVALGGSSYAASSLAGGAAGTSGACPAGMRAAVGECIDLKAHAPEYFNNAEGVCAALGRRLPARGELHAFGVDYPKAMTAEEWTDTAYYLPDPPYQEYRAYILQSNDGAGSARTVSAFTKHPYRCVTGPSN